MIWDILAHLNLECVLLPKARMVFHGQSQPISSRSIIQMKQKEITKRCMMISKWKNLWYAEIFQGCMGNNLTGKLFTMDVSVSLHYLELVIFI